MEYKFEDDVYFNNNVIRSGYKIYIIFLMIVSCVRLFLATGLLSLIIINRSAFDSNFSVTFTVFFFTAFLLYISFEMMEFSLKKKQAHTALELEKENNRSKRLIQ